MTLRAIKLRLIRSHEAIQPAEFLMAEISKSIIPNLIFLSFTVKKEESDCVNWKSDRFNQKDTGVR